MFFDKKKYLVEYYTHHIGENNHIIHIIFLSSIIWAIAGLLSLFGTIVDTPDWLVPFLMFVPEFQLDINLGTVFIFLNYFAIFIMDPIVGFVFFPPIFMQLILIQLINQNFSLKSCIIRYVCTLLVSITANLIGHKYVDQTQPAIFERKYKLIPFYHFFSVYTFFMYIGYRPFLYQDIKDEANLRVAAMRKEQALNS
ncbi:hypothetical protein BB560_001197 [Smittium megazygosporum]|uniref:Uncharacterized protein n=1 Tax=Smittium megazygosporum TaxID=133381 RepID=A0A2T9ZI91_9FUNG|nr:hypothetical protein BB560_001197 [Smittium megazygosporum]